MRLSYTAGERMFVDFSGDTASWVDSDSGEVHKARSSWAVLGCSSTLCGGDQGPSVERRGELGVPVADEEAETTTGIFESAGEVAGDLGHPEIVGVSRFGDRPDDAPPLAEDADVVGVIPPAPATPGRPPRHRPPPAGPWP